jgi:hypothetical protein
MKHVMIDLETLGITADAVILSVGAVKFDLDSDKIDDAGFYASVSIDSNLDAGRTISEATLLWWLKQSKDAQQVFHEPKQSLEAALASLSDWFGHNKRYVWSNGASFDIPMMEHAYSKFGWDAPWEFYNSRCVRTYRSLPCADRVPKPANDHHALRDAINQAKYVQAVHAAMKVAA